MFLGRGQMTAHSSSDRSGQRRCTQVYSQMWPQPVGQNMLEASHSCMWAMCPPWQHPWHQTDTPFTGWWLKAYRHTPWYQTDTPSLGGGWKHTNAQLTPLHWVVAESKQTHTMIPNWHPFTRWWLKAYKHTPWYQTDTPSLGGGWKHTDTHHDTKLTSLHWVETESIQTHHNTQLAPIHWVVAESIQTHTLIHTRHPFTGWWLKAYRHTIIHSWRPFTGWWLKAYRHTTDSPSLGGGWKHTDTHHNTQLTPIHWVVAESIHTHHDTHPTPLHWVVAESIQTHTMTHNWHTEI